MLFLSEAVAAMTNGKSSIHGKPYSVNPRKTETVRREFPAGMPVDLSGLKVVGTLNVDDPADPINKSVI